MFATIYIPNFLLQSAMRHDPELGSNPLALIDDRTPKAVVIELNAPAKEAGVTCGMAPSQGLARCANLKIKTRDRAQEKVVADAILQLAFTLSPDVETSGTGVLTVQFTDWRNVDEKVRRVISAANALQITACAGIAPTADASLIAAHVATPVLRIDEPKSFLAALPVELLTTI